ncbi:MAG: hypothetical protein EOP48_18100 [Sphingobacteriales bacterium]|nr:MAG: hypothetical protein EOP48_18100 [Sphingobacteriales bacterium]
MGQLKQIYVSLHGIDVADYKDQPAHVRDFDLLVKGSCKVNLENQQPIIYLANGPKEMEELLPLLQELNYSTSQRRRLGKKNKSILFGSVPANINKSNFCTYGAVANQDNLLHSLLFDKYSAFAQSLLKNHLPGWSQVYDALFKRKKIHPDYRMAETIWTSGIINYNSPHNYHYDTMNVDKMISAMITFKGNCEGGYLCFPEYRLAVEVKNNSMIFFSGKSILHGVTPMIIGHRGYRLTAVYYTTEAVTRCDSQKDEIQKALKYERK